MTIIKWCYWFVVLEVCAETQFFALLEAIEFPAAQRKPQKCIIQLSAQTSRIKSLQKKTFKNIISVRLISWTPQTFMSTTPVPFNVNFIVAERQSVPEETRLAIKILSIPRDVSRVGCQDRPCPMAGKSKYNLYRLLREDIWDLGCLFQLTQKGRKRKKNAMSASRLYVCLHGYIRQLILDILPPISVKLSVYSRIWREMRCWRAEWLHFRGSRLALWSRLPHSATCSWIAPANHQTIQAVKGYVYHFMLILLLEIIHKWPMKTGFILLVILDCGSCRE